MADPCECLNFFVHEARMRQLIALVSVNHFPFHQRPLIHSSIHLQLRNSQQSCTDDNCLDGRFHHHHHHHHHRMPLLHKRLRVFASFSLFTLTTSDFLYLGGRNGESGLFTWAFMALLIVAVILLYMMKPTRTRPQSKEGRDPDGENRDDAGPVY